VLRLFSIAVCLAALAIGAMAGPLLHVFGSLQFSGAAPVVFPLVVSLGIVALTWIVEIGINLSKRSQFKLIAYILAAVTTYALIAILAPFFGILGGALGALAGSIVRIIVTVHFAQRLYPLPWNLRPVAFLVGSTVVTGMCATVMGLVEGSGWAILMSFGAGLGILVLALRFLLTPEEWLADRSRNWAT
jgi:O-antigen/teichoic acid export membrane protein